MAVSARGVPPRFSSRFSSPLPLLLLFLALAPASAGAQVRAVLVPATADILPSPSRIILAAQAFLGVPYVHGGDTKLGVDCSGLVYRVFHDVLGVDLPRAVESLFRAGEPEGARLHVGDLVFFDTDDTGGRSTPTHVGVYSGGGRFLHAASEGTRTGVTISSLGSPYYSQRYLGARRVFPWRAPVLALTVTDDPVATNDPRPFPSREPLTIEVHNGMSGGGPLDITIFRDGAKFLSRRIVPGGRTPAEVQIVPDIGTWAVSINRIFKGRQLASVTFRVEE